MLYPEGILASIYIDSTYRRTPKYTFTLRRIDYRQILSNIILAGHLKEVQ